MIMSDKDRIKSSLEEKQEYLALSKGLKEKSELLDHSISELIKLQTDLERLHPDFEKYCRKMDEQHKNATEKHEKLILRLLYLLDDFNGMMKNESLKASELEAFINSIFIQLQDIINKEGVFSITVIKGQMFDPYKHEVSEKVISGELSEDSIVEKLKEGYMLGSRVIKRAQVAVACKDMENEKEEEKGIAT